jgi:hypothetical protein
MKIWFKTKPFLERKIASFESKEAKVMDKFHKEKCSLWKFKIEMVLASMDLWDIVDKSKKAPPSNAYPKVLKEY